MPDPSLYLFDGFNILHAGSFRNASELVDQLAGFVALKGARGVVVFDGSGEDRVVGPLEVRYASHADALLERLAAEHRGQEHVCLVSSDSTLRGTAGHAVEQRSSSSFLADFPAQQHRGRSSSRVGDRLDDETRAALERLRRGEH
ncbi:MAG TPA: NYN domain-containing protein [Gaiellaceae bacterium]|nr:NYN domain-containing protein [Gaiellaceae bacterium]